MHFSAAAGALWVVGTLTNVAIATGIEAEGRAASQKITPKVFIIDMFPPEADAWYGRPEFNLLAHNITVPGFSPLYPEAHCTPDYQICQLVTGESGKRRHALSMVPF